MQVTIKIKDLYEQFADNEYQYIFLCTFIRDVMIKKQTVNVNSCGKAIRELFKDYFQLTPDYRFGADSITAWFIHRVDDPKADELFIKLNDGTCIDFPDAYESRKSLRLFMMKHILEKDPEATITFKADVNQGV